MLALLRLCRLAQAMPCAPAARLVAPLLPLRHAEEALFRQPHTCIARAHGLSCMRTYLTS